MYAKGVVGRGRLPMADFVAASAKYYLPALARDFVAFGAAKYFP
jgi:hypothetical protein